VLTDTAEQTRVIAIVGPTAVGKTARAEEIALRLHGEIISADSMQVYRGMDIGTAKPPAAERAVPYSCLDLVDPGEEYSAALFQTCARESIADIASRNRLPVIVGGTGLYLRAALDDLRFPHGETTGSARLHYERLAEEMGPEALLELLRERDPSSADLIHPNNVRRTIRALEMADCGVSYADQTAGFSKRESVYDTVFIGLTMDREQLYERIGARVDAMLEAGLLDEIRDLVDAGFRDALTAAQAIGYKEFVPVIEQGRDVHEAAEEVKKATRRYAKRQLSWFRGDPRVQWIDVTDLSPAELLSETLRLVESKTP